MCHKTDFAFLIVLYIVSLPVWRTSSSIVPSYAAGIFHICEANISHRRYFTRSRGTNFTEKGTCNRKCLFLVGEGGFEPPKPKQQIYSLPHLTALELSHIQFSLRLEKNWSWWTDSNPRPADYKSAALPAELHQHLNARIIYHKSSVESSPKSKKIEKIVYFPLLSSSVMTAAEFFAARAVNFE